MTKLMVDNDGIRVEIEGNSPIYFHDNEGKITPERFSWIDRFLGIKQVKEGYELLYCIDDGSLAKWSFDTSGLKLKFHSLDEHLLADIANEFQLDINNFLPELSIEFKQNEIAKKYYKKAQKYLTLGKHSKAEYCYSRAATLATNNYSYIQELAQCLSLENKFSKALDTYLFLAAKYPDIDLNIWHFKHRLITYIKKTKKSELLNQSIEIFERITSITYNRSSALELLGELYWHRGKTSKALQLKALASTEKNLRLKNIKLPNSDQIDISEQTLRLPDFLVIGPQKSGTTALYQYLTDHPHICSASVKEIFFFDFKYDFGIDWYKSHFPIIPEFDYLTGEASATYFNSVKAMERIAEILPNVKLIFIIRDPIDRAISDYYMKVRDGLESRDMKEAIISEIDFFKRESVDFLEPGSKFFIKHKGYVRNGLYFYFLKMYMDVFDLQNTILINSGKLLNSPRETMKTVFEFLGVEDHKGHYPLINKGNYSKKVDQSVFNDLSNFFKPHNQLLEDLIYTKLNWK